ncbi:MAG: prohibitin family protein [Endomicrobium sp.]|jgi:regulator of protease activity HflC (stomatin/prohibitin superfamily)|nr:prohibitin family protein [Endomicrobium sp.]
MSVYKSEIPSLNSGDVKKAVKTVTTIVIVLAVLSLVFGSFFIVPVGFVGVRINIISGKTESFERGTYLKVPVVHKVVNYDVKTQRQEFKATSASKDLQAVHAIIVVNFRPDYSKVNDIHTNIGSDYLYKVVEPAVQEAAKAAISKLPVEMVVVERENLRASIEERLKQKLLSYNIIIENVNITNIDFSNEFNRVVEEKQIEEQKVKKAQYQRLQAEEEKKRQILLAEAEAQKQQLLKQSVNKEVIGLKWIEKWDGRLPVYMMGDGQNVMLAMPNSNAKQ